MQSELASMLGEHVERHRARTKRRDLSRRVEHEGSAAPPDAVPIELHPAVVDAIASAVDQAVERVLPDLLAETLARVLPVAVEAAMADTIDLRTPSESARPDPDPARSTIIGLRRDRGA